MKQKCKKHSWKKTKTKKKHTCQKTGVDIYTCSKCKATKNVTTAKTAHKYANKICKVCGYTTIKKVKPTIKPPTGVYPYAKKLFSPSNCPQHFWEYDHCFYCNAPNPKPGKNKGWDMSKKADHEHVWEGVAMNENNTMFINKFGLVLMEDDVKHDETHRCKFCSIEEPWISIEFCGCCGIVWSSLEHPDNKKTCDDLYRSPVTLHSYRGQHGGNQEGWPYLIDPYFAYGGKTSVHNPLYMQNNITGKTVWDTLGVTKKVLASYDNTSLNTAYSYCRHYQLMHGPAGPYTEACWTRIPTLLP